jgi:hypothetical protein
MCRSPCCASFRAKTSRKTHDGRDVDSHLSNPKLRILSAVALEVIALPGPGRQEHLRDTEQHGIQNSLDHAPQERAWNGFGCPTRITTVTQYIEASMIDGHMGTRGPPLAAEVQTRTPLA